MALPPSQGHPERCRTATGLVELWQGAQEEATEGPEQNHTALVGI